MAVLKGRAFIAYLLVCVLWGSTYLFIRIGVEELPPVLFAGVRFFAAGLILAAIAVALGQRLPRGLSAWRDLSLTGIMFLVTGNAVVVWAEQFIESGSASVYVATMPLWAALIAALLPGAEGRITGRVAAGLLIGFLGTVLLAGTTPRELMAADLRGPVALLLASSSWAAGSIYSKRHPVDATPYIASAVQMVAGGGVLIVVGLLLGEAPDFHLTWKGAGALAYLIVFGSIVGYTAYAYALKNAPPTVVNTYAYVNPVVAVLLGWLALHEPVTTRTVAAMVLVLGAVVWIQLAPGFRLATAEHRAVSDTRRREAAA